MQDPPGPRQFETTQWSLISAAKRDEANRIGARRALEELCRTYWYPLYVFVRSRGYSADDAQDLTQAFFARIIEKDGFAAADRERGRFRSYLLGAMKHFLANEWHRERTQKRGGQLQIIEWDALDPESRYAGVSNRPEDPERLFDREWAMQIVSGALQALRSDSEHTRLMAARHLIGFKPYDGQTVQGHVVDVRAELVATLKRRMVAAGEPEPEIRPHAPG